MNLLLTCQEESEKMSPVEGESWKEDTGKPDAKMSATEPIMLKMEEPTKVKQSSVIGNIGRSMATYYLGHYFHDMPVTSSH